MNENQNNVVHDRNKKQPKQNPKSIQSRRRSKFADSFPSVRLSIYFQFWQRLREKVRKKGS